MFGAWATLSFFLFSLPTWSQPLLTVGLPAPALAVQTWLQGENPPPNQITVIDFWATWCGPCLQTIPHLNTLAEGFHQNVHFVAISTMGDKVAEATDFVHKQAFNSYIRVGFDGDSKLLQTWVKASGRRGIPVAFVLNADRSIAFIGHPNHLTADVLQAIIDGRWQGGPEQAHLLHKQKQEAEAKDLYKNLILALNEAHKNKDWNTALQLAERGSSLKNPLYVSSFLHEKASLLIQNLDRVEEGLELISSVVKRRWDHPQALGSLLLLMTHPKIPAERWDRLLAHRVALQICNLIDHNDDPSLSAHFQKHRWLLLKPVAEFYHRVGMPALAAHHYKLALESHPPEGHGAVLEAGLQQAMAKPAAEGSGEDHQVEALLHLNPANPAEAQALENERLLMPVLASPLSMATHPSPEKEAVLYALANNPLINYLLRQSAIEGLGRMRSHAAKPVLLSIVKTALKVNERLLPEGERPAQEMAWAAIDALGEIADVQAVPWLVQVVQHSSQDLRNRQAAITALAKMEAEEELYNLFVAHIDGELPVLRAIVEAFPPSDPRQRRLQLMKSLVFYRHQCEELLGKGGKG